MLVSTDGVAAGERFGFWREVMTSATWAPKEARCDRRLEAGFQAEMNVCELGSVQAVLMTATPYQAHRTPKLIRRSDPEYGKLALDLRGTLVFAQGDRRAQLSAGDFVVYDTSRPCSTVLTPDTPTHQMLDLGFPRRLLPLPPRALERVTAVRICGATGIGALAGRILVDIARHIDEYSPADILRLSTLALDVLAAALAHELHGDTTYLPPESRQRALWARIHAFIDQRLGDPDLTPAAIAAAHGISVSYLHKLFHNQGLTVAAMIRRRRLERIHRDLADPLLATRPVHAIAARWGFTSAAHFSRSFRSAFGLSPQEYRRSAAPPGPGV